MPFAKHSLISEVAPANVFPLTTTKGASVQWLFDLEQKGWTVSFHLMLTTPTNSKFV